MTTLITNFLPLLLAADETTGEVTARVYDLPHGPWQWLLYACGLAALIAFVIVVYLRDTSDSHPFWKVWLTALRLCVVAALAVIAFNPQERTQTLSFRPSRVAILVDTSLSMEDPEGAPEGTPSAPAEKQSRSAAVRRLLADSELLAKLRQDHDVSLYTFDTAIAGPHHVFRTNDPRAQTRPPSNDGLQTTTASADTQTPPDWEELLRPRGLETRLGESLADLVRQAAGRTLSGIVVVTDGASNAGIVPDAAADAAKKSKVRLLTVGVGSTQKQVNLQVAGVQAPTVVHKGDAYELVAFVKGQGLAGKGVEVSLLSKPQGAAAEPELVDTKHVLLLEDGIPVEVKFPQQPTESGGVEFVVRARTSDNVPEFRDDDNVESKSINVIDRKMRVLLLAGGPMRDYHFVRNMLYRHPGIELDVWLQSASAGAAVSQESDRLLLQFPQTREEFFGNDTDPGYDVVVAFDPDWGEISEAGVDMLREWIYAHAGGLILVAGDVFTPRLAGAHDSLQKVLELYPVVLEPRRLDARFDQQSQQAWPVSFTREGQEAGFLQLEDEAADSAQTWKEFGGFYACYPTSGPKAGAAVYAHFSDPRQQTDYGEPILLASQFYGSGRTLYIGTPEMWRLRAVDEEYFDRFWTKAVREMGQARMKRGTNRGMLLPERKEYSLGQTIRTRARLLDPQFNPLIVESVSLEVYDPAGKPQVPAARLVADPHRPGEYVGDFRANLPGTYKLELPIPDSAIELSETIDVRLPNLEFDNSRQDAQLLRNLASDTGGTYVTLEQAAVELPARLPNRGEPFHIDERLRTLWDRQWVMYLLVGLLSVEWLTRKLLKLA